MKSILKYLIRSHLFLSLCSFFFLFGLHYEYELSFIYALMISFGIIGVYNAHRLWKFKKGRLPEYMKDWVFLYRNSILALSITTISAAMLLYYLFFSGDALQDFLTAICVLISVFYVKRLGAFSLREIPYMKVLFVISIWYFLFFLFPHMLFKAQQHWGLSFLFLLIILIPSDIKDVYFDHQKMRTIPQVTGLNKSVRLIQLIVICSLMILLINMNEIRNATSWLVGFTYLFTLTLFYSRIGYKYFFVFADFTFLVIGAVSIFLKYS